MLSTIVVIALCLLIIVSAWWVGFVQPTLLKIKHEPEYREYEPYAYLDKVWFDKTKIGTCGECGMDDAPVIESGLYTQRCKWCSELSSLGLHLATHGVRRHKKEYR